MQCKQCKKDVPQTPGKKAKEFCGSTCRHNFWYAANKKGKKATKKKQPGNVAPEKEARKSPKNAPTMDTTKRENPTLAAFLKNKRGF